MNLNYNTEEFAQLIKSLLSLEKNSRLTFQTAEDRIELRFTGSKSKVQQEIFSWLKIRAEV